MVTVRAGTGLNAPSATIAVLQAPWQAPESPIWEPDSIYEFDGNLSSIPFRFIEPDDNPNNPTLVPLPIDDDIRSTWRRAVAYWNSVPGVRFVEWSTARSLLFAIDNPDNETRGLLTPHRRRHPIWDDSDDPDDLPLGSNDLVNRDTSPDIPPSLTPFRTFDGLFNIAQIGPGYESRTGGSGYDHQVWRSVATHELAHVLGIQDNRHSGKTIMSTRDRNILFRPTIHDVHGVREENDLMR